MEYCGKNKLEKLQIRIYKTIVESILLCRAKTWKTTQRNRKRLERFKSEFLRKSCSVSKLDRMPNEEIKIKMN